MFKSVGGFAANSGHAKSANTEQVFEQAGFLEANILDRNKINNIGRARKEGGDGVLDETFVGDIETIARIDVSRDESGNPDGTKDNEDNQHKEGTRAGIEIKDESVATVD